MKFRFKWTVPYLVFGSMLFVEPYMSVATPERDDKKVPVFHNNDSTFGYAKLAYANAVPYNTAFENRLNDFYLDSKADSLCDAYISNMLRAQAKLNPLLGKHGYTAAVRAELPGAPVGQHCVWGQYTQLSRALDEMGDTLTIIPQGARTACVQFKYHMRDKYKSDEYQNCIHDGVIHESDSAYNVALTRFLTKNKVTSNTPDSLRQVLIQKFAGRNFSADGLDSGAILIVPRYRGSRNTFHAIMYLGRGKIENGQFIADENGRHIYTGHNRENIGDLFKTYDMSNVFAADTRKIVRAEYAKELQRIESMSKDELVQFVVDENYPENILRLYPRDMLMRLARDKYFGRAPVSQQQNLANLLAKPDIATTPQQLLLSRKLERSL